MACLAPYADCAAGRLQSKPGEFDVTRMDVAVGPRRVEATYVKPARPLHPGEMLVFATGDGGWMRLSAALFEHLAGLGYLVAGYSAPDVIKFVEKEDSRVSTSEAADRLVTLFAQAKSDLGLPQDAPIVVVGYSRGATMVAFAALHPQLRDSVRGAIAIALTREADYLRAPPPERAPDIEVDKQGRIQIYPALKFLGSTPVAIIQSTNDPYVPAAESRQLLGPDTPTLRLYEVESSNHRFGGARDKVIEDVDDALAWIEGAKRAAAQGAARPESLELFAQ
jgi:pimeloyl-ACP methyl ester carboxylesterase